MLHCRLIYMLSILCVRLTIKVKVGIPEIFKVGWYPPPPPQKKKLGRATLRPVNKKNKEITKIFQDTPKIFKLSRDRMKTNENSVDQQRSFRVLNVIFFLLLLGLDFLFCFSIRNRELSTSISGRFPKVKAGGLDRQF